MSIIAKSEHSAGMSDYPKNFPRRRPEDIPENFPKHITLPPYILYILDALEGEGHGSWVVGGFVRDAIMGRAANDIDIATAAHWKDVQRIMEAAGARTRKTGVKHGTITVVVESIPERFLADISYNEAGASDAEGKLEQKGLAGSCEVTTFRSDGAYSNARHPDSVSFVGTIEEDLARRDFTINAIAYSPKRGFCDPYGGIEDIRGQLIRTVGDAKSRFSEDALRILRACRFASQLGFSIEDASFRAMVSNKSLLARISSERITHELDELLMGDYVCEALLQTVDVLCFVLPELAAMKGCAQVTKYHIYDVYEHTAHAVQAAAREKPLRWAALCHDMGKPASAFFDEDGIEHFYGHAEVGAQITQGLMDRLPVSNAFKSEVVTLVKNHNDVILPTKRSIKRALLRLGGDVELFRKLIELKRADILAHAPEYVTEAKDMDEILATLDEVIASEEAFSLKDLAINGKDLIAAGVSPGKRIGQILQAALKAVVDEELPNDRAALLDFCKDEIIGEADRARE